MGSSLIGPNNGRGRPKGAINHATREMKEFLHEFLSSEDYRESAKSRVLRGEAPHIETYFLQLLYGKPKETLDVNVSRHGDEELSLLSTEQLAERAGELQKQLDDARALEAAIPAEYRIESGEKK